MTRQEAKDFLSIITAFAEGKTIQHCSINTVQGKTIQHSNMNTMHWANLNDDINFNHPHFYYRIKPEPQYIPFTKEDATLFLGKAVKWKKPKVDYQPHFGYSVITDAFPENVSMSGVSRSYEQLFAEYTFLDGSPCGKEV